MIQCKEIDDYIKYVEKHPKWINKDRRLLIENIVKPTLKRSDIRFDEKTFQNCIKYITSNYYKLFPYQKFIYAFAFMYKKKNDQPVFPEIFVMMGRGNGKDGFMAPLANFFQTPLYGVKDYNIELVANSEKQIKDTFQVPHDMLCGNPKFAGKFKVTAEEITNLATGSKLRYNSSNASTADGKRPGCVFFNEFHAYENYDNINVYESAAGKVPQFREIIVTTNGYMRDGPLDDLLLSSKKILETGKNPLGIFPFICRLDDVKEADDPTAWHKANPSLEYMPVLQDAIEKDYLKQKEIPSKRPEFLTKRMNLPESKTELTVTSWENILAASYKDTVLKVPRDEVDTRGKLAIVGIDYADVRDFVSAGVLTLTDDGVHKWRQHTWICAQSPFLNGVKFPIGNQGMTEFQDFEVIDEPTIPIDAVINKCMEYMADYQVVKISMDTYRYNLFREKFQEVGVLPETKQNPNGILRLIRRVGSATGIIAPTIEKLFSEHMIDFGQSAIMRWYTNNVKLEVDSYGNYKYGKIEPIRRKTDGFMAFAAAEFSENLLKENMVYV